MDNIIFEKVWQDDEVIELKITGISQFVTAHQTCYIQDTNLREISNRIIDYSKEYSKQCYIEMGNKEGNFTPAFSMNILEASKTGHVKVEVDIEIADTKERNHRCCFYVNSELYALEKLGNKFRQLVSDVVGNKVSLNDI
ncbi:UNVERIFIED_CONTAM: hypothetical protein Cloal_4459 [Acetivibrio alkalicellulosi]